MPQKLGNWKWEMGKDLLEMGKDLKIKHSVSSPPLRSMGELFHKKALHGGKNFFGQFF